MSNSEAEKSVPPQQLRRRPVTETTPGGTQVSVPTRSALASRKKRAPLPQPPGERHGRGGGRAAPLYAFGAHAEPGRRQRDCHFGGRARGHRSGKAPQAGPAVGTVRSLGCESGEPPRLTFAAHPGKTIPTSESEK